MFLENKINKKTRNIRFVENVSRILQLFLFFPALTVNDFYNVCGWRNNTSYRRRNKTRELVRNPTALQVLGRWKVLTYHFRFNLKYMYLNKNKLISTDYCLVNNHHWSVIVPQKLSHFLNLMFLVLTYIWLQLHTHFKSLRHCRNYVTDGDQWWPVTIMTKSSPDMNPSCITMMLVTTF